MVIYIINTTILCYSSGVITNNNNSKASYMSLKKKVSGYTLRNQFSLVSGSRFILRDHDWVSLVRTSVLSCSTRRMCCPEVYVLRRESRKEEVRQVETKEVSKE